MRALLAGDGKFDPFYIAKFYGHWIASEPFMLGRTTSSGLGPLKECLDNPNPELAYEAARGNPGATSQSNGSLMKVTPLAVWS